MSPSVNKQVSLPSDLDSTHPHTHVLTAPSNARAVVTAPPWAQDEPPSPADQYDEINKLGPKVIAPTRPPDLASSSTSSFDRESDHRSRWWTFVRPRQGSIKRDRRVIDTTNRDQPQTDDRQSQYLVSLPGRRSDESPVLRSTSPAPFAPAGSKTLRRDSPRRGRNETHDSQYAHMPERQDTESGEKSTLARSRKNRFTGFILTNIYVPLLFRFINITFTTTVLAVAIRMRQWEMEYHVMGAVGSSPTLVIIFAPLTLVHVMVAIYVEYFSRPLGLWRTSRKLAHTLLEVCFICAWSAALSLCFDNYFTSPIPCATASSIAWYSQLTRPPLNSPGIGQIGDTLCDSQLALICLVMVGLIMYCTNLVISLFRIFEKVKYHAGTRRRV
ncbi:hypothetical protein V8E55_000702 [Tylopilus felleus]